MKISKGLIITLVVLGAIGIGGLSFYGYVNSLRSEGIDHETVLSAQYQTNQNELSTYVVSIKEQVGIANIKSAKLDTILRHAVEGRYGEDGFKPNGAMFSAITEAYPDLTQNLSLFDEIAASVRSGRIAFKGKQDQLIDRARVYNRFLEDGLLQRFVVQNLLGHPTAALKARIGTNVVSGQAALDQIQVIVLTEGTAESFKSGTMAPVVQ